MSTQMNEVFKILPPFYVPPKSLDITTMKELPESHAWTFSDNYPSVNVESPVPVVDLNAENVIELLGNGFKTFGIVQVVNHNIKKELLDKIIEVGKSIFDLPMEQKLKAERPPNGVFGYGMPRNTSTSGKLLWCEGFTIVVSPHEHARNLWPTDYKTYSDLIEEYNMEMKTLAQRLTRLSLRSLGISEDDVKLIGGTFEGGSSGLQLNSYPVCPVPDRVMGLAPHTDSTIITILHQNDTSGLQLLQEGYGWITIPPLLGALIVNVGDLLHILSNGLYVSVFHRAIVNPTQYRLSIAYLYGPQSSVKILPLPKLVDEFHPALYRPVTWNEYVAIKAKYFTESLSTIRVCR